MTESVLSKDLSAAGQSIQQAQNIVDQSLSGLKKACTEQGKFNTALLDNHQWVSYDLARFSAEISAASNMLVYAARARLERDDPDETLLEETLALTYCAEMYASVRAGMAPRLIDFQVSSESFTRAFDTPELLTWMANYSSTAKLQALGKEIQDSQGYLGNSQLEAAHEAMSDNFLRFAKDVVDPMAEHIHRFDTDIPNDIIEPLARMGVFGLSVKERFGGLQPDEGEDNLGMIVVTEALSTGSLCAAGSLITRPEILSKALMAGGTEEQQRYWLPRVASGETLSAIAVTEPDYGSDVAGVRLPATRTDGGWLLNGSKTWCTFCGRANLIVVLARTNPDLSAGHKGLSVFLVEKPAFEGHQFKHVQENAGGAVSGRAIPTIGYRGMHSFEVFFDNYFVPDANLVGGESGLGQGFYTIMRGFSGGRIQTAARAIGIMQASFQKALSYSADRKVFGQAVGDYQLTQVKLARMGLLLAVCRQFTYAVGRLLDQGEGQMEASLVKVFACKVSEWVTREALQIHGGMGYSEETAVSRYYVDSRVLSIFEGAEETLALKVIARSLIENAR
ncbi:MAG: acyl-CoA dehydrogenase family protein [Pseudomonadales bacterium]